MPNPWDNVSGIASFLSEKFCPKSPYLFRALLFLLFPNFHHFFPIAGMLSVSDISHSGDLACFSWKNKRRKSGNGLFDRSGPNPTLLFRKTVIGALQAQKEPHQNQVPPQSGHRSSITHLHVKLTPRNTANSLRMVNLASGDVPRAVRQRCNPGHLTRGAHSVTLYLTLTHIRDGKSLGYRWVRGVTSMNYTIKRDIPPATQVDVELRTDGDRCHLPTHRLLWVVAQDL